MVYVLKERQSETCALEMKLGACIVQCGTLGCAAGQGGRPKGSNQAMEIRIVKLKVCVTMRRDDGHDRPISGPLQEMFAPKWKRSMISLFV